MGKLPGFTFYPGDWQKDPSLRRCSKAAKGVWMDMLCLLFECPVRGVFVDAGGRPWGDEEIAAAIGGDMSSNLECMQELLAKGVAQRDARGAIFSRRMVRDEQERQAAKERKRKQRAGQSSNILGGDDGFRPEPQPGLFSAPHLVAEGVTAIDRIAHLHPANVHLKNKPVPVAQRTAIADAIARDGEEAVVSGTRSLAAGVAEWESSDWRFIPNAIRFYQECGYLKPPQTWQRNRKKTRSEKCMLHPQAALTEWGECGECYGNKYVSGCQPA
jgi:hypothetical protein